MLFYKTVKNLKSRYFNSVKVTVYVNQVQVFSYDHYGRDRGGELGHPVSSAGGVPSLLGNVGLE